MKARNDMLSRAFGALADPTRRDLVARLAIGDATVSELAAPHDMTLQAVSKHLSVLEECGLVAKTKESQRRHVHLEAQVFNLMTEWITRYQRVAEERFLRLDVLLAESSPEAHATASPNAHASLEVRATTVPEVRATTVPDARATTVPDARARAVNREKVRNEVTTTNPRRKAKAS